MRPLYFKSFIGSVHLCVCLCVCAQMCVCVCVWGGGGEGRGKNWGIKSLNQPILVSTLPLSYITMIICRNPVHF